MSDWNHPICMPCWNKRCADRGEPGRIPVRVLDAENEPCAFCDGLAEHGIFVRQDPKTVTRGPTTDDQP